MQLSLKNIEILEMDDDAIDIVRKLENVLLDFPQVKLDTSHVLHAGMYARTVTIPKGVVATGAFVKIPTVLIVQGHCKIYIGDNTTDLIGYKVIPASANRKQAVYACEDTSVTMIFATNANSVEEAEMEFTDEFSSLMSNNDLAENKYITTGVAK
jgi:hypothetical protein